MARATTPETACACEGAMTASMSWPRHFFTNLIMGRKSDPAEKQDRRMTSMPNALYEPVFDPGGYPMMARIAAAR